MPLFRQMPSYRQLFDEHIVCDEASTDSQLLDIASLTEVLRALTFFGTALALQGANRSLKRERRVCKEFASLTLQALTADAG